MGKRVFDILCSLAALILLSPIMLFIAVWVRLDSRGPALFQQVRVGKGECRFMLLKFRSMGVGAEGQGPSITTATDQRITRAGNILRKTKLDELPQLINVIRGDMSIVGPRPEVPKYVEKYSEHERCLIFTIRPGITDNASILFRNESVLLAEADDAEGYYIEEMLPKKLALYVEYAENHSLAGDLKVIWKTIHVVLFS